MRLKIDSKFPSGLIELRFKNFFSLYFLCLTLDIFEDRIINFLQQPDLLSHIIVQTLPLPDEVYLSGKFGDLMIPFSASVILPPQSPKGLCASMNMYLKNDSQTSLYLQQEQIMSKV